MVIKLVEKSGSIERAESMASCAKSRIGFFRFFFACSTMPGIALSRAVAASARVRAGA